MLEARNRIFSGARTALAYSCKFLRDLPHDTSAGETLLPYRVNRPLSFAKYNASRSKDTRFILDNGILINFNGRYSNKLTYVASFFFFLLSFLPLLFVETLPFFLSFLSFAIHPLCNMTILFLVFPQGSISTYFRVDACISRIELSFGRKLSREESYTPKTWHVIGMSLAMPLRV